ncbi:MAG: hypothetical protein V4481_05325 [Patescibacteria group bacterium]
MATVKTVCPQCIGQGLIGDATVSRCPQCLGTGMISSDDSQTLNTINLSNTGAGKTPLVVVIPPPVPKAVATTISRKKD